MKFKLKMRIGTRVFLGFVLVLIFLCLVGLTAVTGFNSTLAAKDKLIAKNYPGVRLAQDTLIIQLNQGMAIWQYLLSGDASYLSRYQNYLQEMKGVVDDLKAVANSEEEKGLLGKIEGIQAQHQEIIENVIALQRAGNLEEAVALNENEGDPLMDQLRQYLGVLIQYEEKQMDAISAQMDKETEKRRTIMLSQLLLAVASAVVISVIVGRSVTKPISLLVAGAENVARGNLQESISIKRHDEIGQLADAFNRMITDLRELVAHVIDSSSRLVQASQELSSSSQETAAAVEQVAGAMSEVASGISQQTKDIDESGTVVNELSTAVRQVAENAQAVSESSSKARQAALKGEEESKQATYKMEKLAESIRNIAQTIAELGDGSKQIGQIVDTIKGIAEQTNLLALNAAIEAARAGEHGRGFAVVAEEVRLLAEQASASADTIAGLIENIRAGTDKTVQAMNIGSREVDDGVDSVKRSLNSFALIVEEIAEVAGQVEQVSAASEEMLAGSEQVVETFQNINGISKEIDARTEEVVASVEQQSNAIETVSIQAEELEKIAEELQGTVAKFKI